VDQEESPRWINDANVDNTGDTGPGDVTVSVVKKGDEEVVKTARGGLELPKLRDERVLSLFKGEGDVRLRIRH
jgi:hypothetical protein